MTQEEQIKQVAEYAGYTERFDLRTDGKPLYQAPIEKGATHSFCYCIDNNEEFIQLPVNSLDWLNPVWVKVYAEVASIERNNWETKWTDWGKIINNYHNAIDTGDIPAALTAVSNAISWLKEQKK